MGGISKEGVKSKTFVDNAEGITGKEEKTMGSQLGIGDLWGKRLLRKRASQTNFWRQRLRGV